MVTLLRVYTSGCNAVKGGWEVKKGWERENMKEGEIVEGMMAVETR